MLGLDYSAGRIPGTAIRDAGYKFVMRYLWFPGQQHAYLNPEEARDLRAAGVAIGPIFESTAERAAQGYAAGAADAHTAAEQLADVGAPADQAIYFTVDFDAPEGVQGAINDYFRGAASVVGVDRVGCYSGFFPLARLLNGGLTRYGWQTLGWSGGNREPRAALFQNGNVTSVAGVKCDINELTGPAGLWGDTSTGGGGVSADDVTKGLYDTRVDDRNVFDWFIQLRQEMADLNARLVDQLTDVKRAVSALSTGGVDTEVIKSAAQEGAEDGVREALDGATIHANTGGTEV